MMGYTLELLGRDRQTDEWRFVEALHPEEMSLPHAEYVARKTAYQLGGMLLDKTRNAGLSGFFVTVNELDDGIANPVCGYLTHDGSLAVERWDA